MVINEQLASLVIRGFDIVKMKARASAEFLNSNVIFFWWLFCWKAENLCRSIYYSVGTGILGRI